MTADETDSTLLAQTTESGSGSEASTTDSSAVTPAESATERGGDVDSASTSTAGSADSGSTVSSTSTSTQPSGVTAGSSDGLWLKIPTLGVDALVSELGYNDEGQLDVPSAAGSVGWYSISARPGESGNALLGGHLNWRGLRGVFERLDELNNGDLIYLVQDGEEMVFQVSLSRSVAADASLQEVLRAPATGSTLTLFTCGGSFDRSAGEYDERLVVNAVRVVTGAG